MVAYVALPGLIAIPDADHGAALEHAVALVRGPRPRDALGVSGVVVGFDDGDFVITWSVRD